MEGRNGHHADGHLDADGRLGRDGGGDALRFAIVGCGRIAERHARHIGRVGRLVAACDVVRERAEAIAEEHGARAYGTLGTMLAAEGDVDVVAVCTPNGLHAEHSVEALRAGCHVLCEKPMALTAADCGRMIQAAERSNRRLFVVKQNRFNPPVAAVKHLLDEGRLGRLYSVQLNCFWNRNEAYYENPWKGTRELDGGILFTQFSHFIDLLYWLAGDVREVRALTDNFAHLSSTEFEDTAVALLRFYGGAVGSAHFTTNSFGGNMEGSLTLFAERGTIKIGGQYLNELEYQCIDGHVIEGLPEGNPPNRYGHYEGSMSNHDRVYENVVEVLQEDGVITTNSFEGLKTVEIIQKIYAAGRRAFQPHAPQPEAHWYS